MASIKQRINKEDILFMETQEEILHTIRNPLVDCLLQIDNVLLKPYQTTKARNKYQFKLYEVALDTKNDMFYAILKHIENVVRTFVETIKHYLEEKYDIKLNFTIGDTCDFAHLSLETVYGLIDKELPDASF
ncbi:hypothetical protein PP175_26510 (plasmid) [Aneurinibacillus sp. Ricciae_BoGa-3]|uniref:hypothetical protein n=1 Tax=Aneurinibacillus sp. Ricciae_BoGa-3 TaxID=3022697 RepID=UPI002342386C|nr:hypothetical protein [Aneurinibacillus sp. Ricciae_BoGa-3]WCK57618.1 hypothetical protein PP175_26510 [Aneurinibacillus sp. Ricciae_BoGa-3]